MSCDLVIAGHFYFCYSYIMEGIEMLKNFVYMVFIAIGLLPYVIVLIMTVRKLTGIEHREYIKSLDADEILWFNSLDRSLFEQDIKDWCQFYKKKIVDDKIVDI